MGKFIKIKKVREGDVFVLKMHVKGIRFLAFALVVCCLFGISGIPALASGGSAESTTRAEHLNRLGLFKGTENGFELDNTPSRVQGFVMLIRLLGKEKEATSGTWSHPFTDVEAWSDKYVGYSYEKGLSKGTSANKFSPDDVLTARDYLTMLLRALNYKDSSGDFKWETSISDASRLGLISSSAEAALGGVTLNRGDMADLSYAALSKKMADSSKTLAETLVSQGVFTSAQGAAEGVIGSGSNWLYTYTAYDGSTISYESQTVYTSEGSVYADIIRVNTKNSRVKVKSAMVGNTIGATANFESIVYQSGAAAVVNGNFFEAYADYKKPIGHVMVGGEFLYGISGLTSVGITKSGEIKWGRPALFTRISSDNAEWSAYEINSTYQDAYCSVLYTPAVGTGFSISSPGYVMVISGGAIVDYYAVAAGGWASIPQGGAVFFMGSSYAATDYFRTPKIGSAVKLEYYLHTPDSEGFSFDGMESILSGGPRLVKNGSIDYTLDDGFNEARFTTASTPRTAIGSTYDGKLLLVSVPYATIQQMRELMLNLGCANAMNLDGGASTSMYYNGSFIRTPGRELTTTLQVFVS